MEYTYAQVRLFSDAIDQEEQVRNRMAVIASRLAQADVEHYKRAMKEMFPDD